MSTPPSGFTEKDLEDKLQKLGLEEKSQRRPAFQAPSVTTSRSHHISSPQTLLNTPRASGTSFDVEDMTSGTGLRAIKEVADIPFSLWDPETFRSRPPSTEEWDILEATVGVIEFGFPFLRVQSLPPGALDTQVWKAAGCILTTEELTDIHPMKKDPFRSFSGNPWELIDQAADYLHQRLDKEGYDATGISVEFMCSCIIVDFPSEQPLSREHLPKSFGGYNVGYMVMGRTSSRELSSALSIVPSMVTYNPVLHSGDRISSNSGVLSSLGAAIRHNNGDYRIMVAAHGFTHLNDDIYSYDKAGPHIGVIRQFFLHSDVALMEPAESFDFDTQRYFDSPKISHPAGEIVPHKDIHPMDNVECWSTFSGPCSFSVFSLMVKVVEVSPTTQFIALNRSFSMYGGVDQELQPSMCGCPIVRELSHDLVGQFRFQSKSDPRYCYAEPVSFLSGLGWRCAAWDEDSEGSESTHSSKRSLVHPSSGPRLSSINCSHSLPYQFVFRDETSFRESDADFPNEQRRAGAGFVYARRLVPIGHVSDETIGYTGRTNCAAYVLPPGSVRDRRSVRKGRAEKAGRRLYMVGKASGRICLTQAGVVWLADILALDPRNLLSTELCTKHFNHQRPRPNQHLLHLLITHHSSLITASPEARHNRNDVMMYEV
ncbi:hypothetical protein BJ508DRAFT_377920 [Ascobolus immersus RN42]|uniref:Uncharacterized protein n=1 Tax=Ascobolus immersus RN42 TaxID=1160509 RepID=A0A3N4HZ49_ASCIM|nr:hypothetical protein BJ508DRAFT_377920 [Ascobolus immersus RN42]